MQLYIVRELSSQISASPNKPPIVFNISNPGFCRSNIMREATGAYRIFVEAMNILLARKTEVGSRTVIAGAAGGLETHGQYLNDGHVGK
jgi:hypothetical protein